MSNQSVKAESGGRGTVPGIQLLRGAAALLVVLSHVCGVMGHAEYFGRTPMQIPTIGGFGVAVFFVISGFIIVIVSLDATLTPRFGRLEYARRRFLRIIPFMWLCVLGYNAFTFLGTGRMEWAPALRALVVWPVGELKPNVIWSLRHEFLFYLLFGLTMLGSRRLWPVLVLWFASPLLIGLALLPFDPAVTPWHPANHELARVVLLGSDTGANVQIGLGFLLGLLWLRSPGLMAERLPGGLVIAAALTIAGGAIITLVPFPPGLERTLLWSALGVVIVGCGIVARAKPGPLRATGVALGNASFSIYLVHNPILLTLLEATHGIAHLLSPVAWLVIYTIATTAGGIVAHHLIEKPLISWLSAGRRVAPWMPGRRSVPR